MLYFEKVLLDIAFLMRVVQQTIFNNYKQLKSGLCYHDDIKSNKNETLKG